MNLSQDETRLVLIINHLTIQTIQCASVQQHKLYFRDPKTKSPKETKGEL